MAGCEEVITEDGKRCLRYISDSDSDQDEEILAYMLSNPYGRVSGSLHDHFPHLVNLSGSADKGCRYCAFLLAVLRSEEITALLGDLFSNFNEVQNIPFNIYAKYEPRDPIRYKEIWNSMRFCLLFDAPDCSEPREWYTLTRVDIICDMTHALATGHNDVAVWLGLDNPSQFLQDPTSYGQEALEWVKDVLTDCDKHDYPHQPKCAGFTDPSFVPTRLINISESDDILHLVSIDEPQQPPGTPRYTTLSYCWGATALPRPSFMTTSKNVDQRKNDGFRISSLPPVLQDAIQVTKSLSIAYIWIDALCILQDMDNDWIRESALLIDIYRSAYVTICSLTPSSSMSFFHPQPRPSVEVKFHSTIDPDVTGTYKLSYQRLEVLDAGWYTYNKVGQFVEPCNRWESRGWTFLERYSSRRMILIDLPFVSVVCPTTQTSFRDDFGASQIYGEPRCSNLHNPFPSRACSTIDYYGEWDNLLSQYSTKLFTFSQDVLPAISGLARWYAIKLSDQYAAGLWVSKLAQGLSWEYLDSDHQAAGRLLTNPTELLARLNSGFTEGHIAPSWSWAGHRVCAVNRKNVSHLFSQLTVSITSDENDKFGRIKNGQLTIVGRTRSFGPGVGLLPWNYGKFDCPPFLLKLADGHDAICDLDWKPVGNMNPSYVCEISLKLILIGRFNGPSYSGKSEYKGEFGFGLILHKAEREGCYLRVGTFHTKCNEDGTVPEVFRSAPIEKVTVI
ncbi:heterokaryon incompatibility protein-domain-containing protein [Cladorrhinum sp. PSN332]|nr:heterokaryon incompatibility protein-domain-containing protein [Cladorrhinum sp. PSN332]